MVVIKIKLAGYVLMFLAIVSYDYNALLLYKSTLIVDALILVIRGVIIVSAITTLLQGRLSEDKTRVVLRYSIYFILMFLLNIVAEVTQNGSPSLYIILYRGMSLTCIWSFLICCMRWCQEEELLKTIQLSYGFLIFLSVLMYYLYPEKTTYHAGYGQTFFMGLAYNRNSFIELVLPYLIASLCLMKQNKKTTIFCRILLILGVIYTVKTGSITSILLIFAVFPLSYLYGKETTKVPIRLLLTFSAVLWCFIIIGDISNLPFIDILLNSMHKSSTLTGRTLLWGETMNIFVRSPLLGFGFDNTKLIASQVLANSRGFYFNDPHNGILYILLTQGMIGVVVWIYMLIIPVIRALRNGNSIITNYSNIFIVIWVFRSFVESCLHYPHVILWIFLILMELGDYKVMSK